MRNSLLGAALALLVVGAARGETVIKKTVTGNPKLQSIECIRFAPDGVLLIGDGRGSQVLAVQTPKAEAPKDAWANPIEKIDEKLAGKLGTTAKGIEIVDLTVNPTSLTAYVAIRLQADKKPLILTVDGAGKVDEFALESVPYVRIVLPKGEKGPISRVTDLAWAGDRLLVSGLANEEFGSKIFSVMGPLENDAEAAVYSTETFHVAHNKWETKAPMTSLMPYEEGGKKYVAGAFACTPVVKYPLESLKPGDKVKGISMIEMGFGNRPLNMISYEKDGKSYVLMNNFRMFHARSPFGPSPYWTVRFEKNLLTGNEKVNEKAQQRVNSKFEPQTDRINQVKDYNGVIHMDRLDNGRALVIRQPEKDSPLTLTALALP